jgi:hypothetical protein
MAARIIDELDQYLNQEEIQDSAADYSTENLLTLATQVADRLFQLSEKVRNAADDIILIAPGVKQESVEDNPTT